MIKILRSQKGQSVWEMLITIIATVAIAFVISEKMLNPISDLHDRASEGITTITGGGM